jgi:hypothetical protein
MVVREDSSTAPAQRLTTFNARTFPEVVRRVLSVKYPGIRAFPENKDGGVDLVWEGPDGSRLVVQCKFLSGKTAGLDRCWASDHANLDRNLRRSENGDFLGEGQYFPWSDEARPITRYILCHNLEPIHLAHSDKLRAEGKKLRDRIQVFFRDVAGVREGFRHLGNLAVEVMSGGELVELSEPYPRLAFSVFGPKLPLGVSLLEDDDVGGSEVLGFAHYLSEGRLPYLSRDEFNRSEDTSRERLTDETELLDRLFSLPPTDPVLVVTGPGGYGKTRLSLELCRLANAADGNIVLRVGEAADLAGIESSIRLTANAEFAILLIDYLETQENFDQILDLVADLNGRHGFKVRVIATCRASYYYAALRGEYSAVVDLVAEAGRPAGMAYRRRVFNYILKRAGIASSQEFRESCGHNPVLAAFLLYLTDTGLGSAEDPTLRELLFNPGATKDFANWLVGRLRRSAQAVVGPMTVAACIQAVAPTLAILPISEERLRDLQTDGPSAAVINILMQDRLLERRGGRDGVAFWSSAHDIVVDHLVSRFIGMSADARGAVEALLQFAESHAELRNVVITLQRVAEVSAFAGIDWLDLFRSRIAASPGPWRNAREALIRTTLLSPSQKVQLLGADFTYWADLSTARYLDNHFAKLAAAYRIWYDQQDRPNTHDPCRVLLPFLEVGCARDFRFTVLSRALRYRPDRFEDAALNVIRSAPMSWELGFVLAGWLERDLPYRSIIDRCLDWLNSRHAASRAGEVVLYGLLTAVVNQASDEAFAETFDRIEPMLDSWLGDEEFADSDRARFLLSGWLRAVPRYDRERRKQVFDRLRPLVEAWLGRHWETEGGTYVILGGFKAAAAVGGEQAAWAFDVLCPAVIRILDSRGVEPEYDDRYMISGWLFAARAKEPRSREAFAALRLHTTRWLAVHGSRLSAAYLLHDWLIICMKLPTAEGLPALAEVRPVLMDWLSRPHRATCEEAGFLYTGWTACARYHAPALPDCVESLERFIEAWLAAAPRAKSFTALAWDAARKGPSQEAILADFLDRLWSAVRLCRQASDPAAAAEALHLLTDIAREPRLPANIPPKERQNFLFTIFRLATEILEVEAARLPMTRIVAGLLADTDLFQPPFVRGGALRPSHLDILSQLRADGSRSGEDGAATLGAYLLYLAAGDTVEREASAELRQLRSDPDWASFWLSAEQVLEVAGASGEEAGRSNHSSHQAKKDDSER